MSNINYKDLLTVVKSNSFEKVKLLLEKQGLKENNHRNNCLALRHAIQAGNVPIVEILLEYGCLAEEAKADVFYTSLDYAQEDKEILRLLLQAGASTAGKDFKQQTPLIRAMNKNCTSAVDTMLSMYDIDSIEPANKNEIIHFTIAAMRGNKKLVESFIQKGLAVNSILSHHYDDWTEYTPLHCAVRHLSVEGVRVLLNFGADMTIPDENGYSSLHLAYYIHKNAIYQKYEVERIIHLILSAHKPFARNPVDRNGTSHLHIACTNSHKQSLEFIKLLLKISSDINAQDKFGHTPLWFAALNNNTEAVKILLNYGADINIKNTSNISLPRQISQLHTAGAAFEILAKHVRKLLFMGYTIDEKTAQVCSASEQVALTELRVLSTELETLKGYKIDNHISLHDILFKSEQQMSRHVKNEIFKNDLTSVIKSNSFPNYGYLLNLKVQAGLKRNRIFDQAKQSLLLLVKIESFPDLCVDSIFNDLTNEDLKNLISVAK